MRIKNHNWQFVPSLFMSFLAIVLICLFVALGRWQLQRADLKRDIQDRFLQQMDQPYQFIQLQPLVDDSIAYRRIKLNGYYLTEQVILVDNKVYQGQAGYHVLMPFIIEGQHKAVLVNRGWVAADFNRNVLPDIRLPIVSDRVMGLVTIPTTDGFRMGEVVMTANWPQRIPYIDLEKIKQGVDYELLPYVIWLAPEVQDYYVRNWKPVWSSPEKSEAYATQWFSFAFIILILYIGLNVKKTTGKKADD